MPKITKNTQMPKYHKYKIQSTEYIYKIQNTKYKIYKYKNWTNIKTARMHKNTTAQIQ